MDGGDFLLSNVDRRVVQMEFDNKQFEKDMQVTVRSLNNFEKNLNNVGTSGKAFEGISKGLDNVKANVKSFSLDAVSNAFEKTQVTISHWEVAAIAAISNVVNSAVNATRNMIRSLTSEPVKQGFEEYELKMNSIQTMLLGSQAIDPSVNLEKVNKTLEELNDYADKTIYSFSDMTENVGKFINAGIKLDDAKEAIMGISNWAAVAGANSQQASHTMYNLSQALATGYVQRIDWKSIEMAQMNNVEFMREALSVAEEVGTVAKEGNLYVARTQDNAGRGMKEAINMQQMFTQGLQYQWLTTEVLTKTLQKYSDETTELGKKAMDAATHVKTFSQLMDTLKEAAGSGWAQTWEIIFGDFEQSKSLWTSINNVVGGFLNDQAKARNEMLNEWVKMGGKDTLLENLKNGFENILKIIKPIKEAFHELFPPTTANTLLSITRSMSGFVSKLDIGPERIEKIKTGFKGLFSILSILKNAISSFIKTFGSSGGRIIDTFLWFFSAIGKIIIGIDEWIKKNDAFVKAFSVVKNIIVSFITFCVNGFKNLRDSIYNTKIPDLINRLKDSLKSLKTDDAKPVVKFANTLELAFTPIRILLEFAKKIINGLAAGLSQIWPTIKKVGVTIAQLFGKMFENTYKELQNMSFVDIFKTLFKALIGGKFIQILMQVASGFTKVSGAIKSFGDILKIFTDIGEAFKKLADGLLTMAQAKALKMTAIGIAVLAVSILLLTTIPSDEMWNAIGAIGAILSELVLAVKIIDKLDLSKSDVRNIKKLATSFISISIAILLMAFAVKKLSSLSTEELTKGLIGVNVLLGAFIGVSRSLNKDAGKMKKTAKAMIILSIATLIMASAAKKVSSLSWEELGKAGIAIGVITGIFIGMSHGLNKNSRKLISSAISMAIFAKAVGMLAVASKPFGDLDWLSLAKIGSAIAGFAGIMAAFSHLVKPVKLLAAVVALRIFSSVFNDISQTFKPIGDVDWMSLLKVGSAIAGFVGIMAAFSHLVKPVKLLAAVVALRIFSSAFNDISQTFKPIGDMDWASLFKAGSAIAGFAGIMAAFSHLVKPVKLLAAVVALRIFSGSLKILSGIVKEISIGIFSAMVGILLAAVLALALIFDKIKDSSEAGFKFAKTVALIGAAFLAAGLGVSLFAAAVAGLGMSFSTIVDFIKGVLSLIPELFKQIGLGIGELIVIFKLYIPKFISAIFEIIRSVLSAIGTLIPSIVDMLGKIIDALIPLLVTYVPKLAQAIIDLIVAVINQIANNIQPLMQAIANLFNKIIKASSEFAKSNEFNMEDFMGMISVLLIIAVTIYIIKSLTKDIKSCLKGVAIIGLVLGALVGAILVISNFSDPAKAIDILKGIASVFLTFAALFAIIGGITLAFDKIPGGSNSVPLAGIFKAVVAFGLVILVMVAVVAIISALVALLENTFKELNILTMIYRGSKIMSAVGEAIGSFFAGIIEPLSKIMTNSGVNVGTILALVPLILALEPLLLVLPILTLFVGAIGALATLIDDNTNWDTLTVIQNGAKIMGGIGEAIGQFVGGFINGAMEQLSKGFMSTMIGFADGLAEFMDHLSVFINALSIINGSVLEKAGQLTLIILEMCAAKLITTITNFFTWMTGGNSLTKFAKELEAMAPYLVRFSNKLRKGHFDGTTVNSAANAALLMSKIVNNLPRDGGLWQNIIGHSQSLKDFGKTFDELGKGLVTFAQHTHKISKGNTEKMKTAAETVKTLASVANEMPKHGGWWQNIIGELTDVDTFGNQLKTLGEGIANFAIATNKISEGNVTRSGYAIGIAEKIASLANSLPNESGGFWGKLFGDQMNIETFGNQLKALGEGIASFAVATNKVSEGNVTRSGNAIGVAEKLASLSATLNSEKDGGFVGWFAGTAKEDLESFSDKIPKLGEALASFAEKTNDIGEVKNVTDTVTAVQNLVTAFKSAKDIGNFNKNFLVHLHDLVYGEGSDYTGDELEKVGSIMGDKPQDVLWNLHYVTDAITELATTFKNVPTDIPSLNTSLLKNLHVLTTGSTFTGYTGDEFKKAGDLLGDKPQDVLWNLHYVTDAITELSGAFKSAKDIGNLNENFLVHLHDLVYGEGSDYTGDELQKVGSIMGDKPHDVLWNLNYVADAIIKLAETFSNESIKNIGNFNSNFLVHLHDLVYGEGDYKGDELEKAGDLLGDNPQDVLCNLHYVADAITELVTCLSGITGLDSESLSTFFDSVSKISKLSVDTIKADFVDRAPEVVQAANDLIFDVGMAFLNKQIPLENNVKSLLLAIPSAFSNNMGEIKTSALSYISGETGVIYAIGKAFIDGQEPLKGNVKDFILSALNAIEPFNSTDPYMPGTFYIAGSNSAWGYIKGINDSLNDVLNAGKSIGEKALEGANEAVDNRSPSHKFEDYVAYNSVLGFVRGFRKRAHLALEAGEYLGQNALNGTQGIASKFENILNSDMNLQPVITPVLDLSQMSIQSDRISGMLNANNSVIAAGRVYSLIEQGRMLRLDARINQNGSPDVVAAVENLINRMDSMEEAIINRPIELDGDRVTKKLTPRVDKALGQRAYYSRRGN